MRYILILSIILACFLLQAQFRNTSGMPDPRIKLLSDDSRTFIDMSKISIDHSFSAGYVSSGDNSLMINEYVAGIKYRISDPLTLKLDLGMSYTPYSSFAIEDQNSSEIYLKSASLDYRPNSKFRMRIDFKNYRPSDLLFNGFNDNGLNEE